MADVVVSRCELPGGGTLEGFEGPHLRVDGQLVQGFETIDRSDFHDPRGGDADAFSVAATADTWFVAVHVGGLWRSTDAGGTWTRVVPTDADVHHVVAGDDGVVVVAAAAGVAVSTDGGATFGPWRTDGLAHRYCTAVARAGHTLVVGSSDGPFGETVLYRGSLERDRFERTGTELPTVAPVHAREVLAGDAGGFRYLDHVSVDGRTWTARS